MKFDEFKFDNDGNHQTQRNLSEILLNQTEINCIYHFPINLVQNGRPYQINRKMLNTM